MSPTGLHSTAWLPWALDRRTEKALSQVPRELLPAPRRESRAAHAGLLLTYDSSDLKAKRAQRARPVTQEYDVLHVWTGSNWNARVLFKGAAIK